MNNDFADEVIRQKKIVEEGARKAALKAKKEIIEMLIEAEIEEILPQRYAKKREGKQTTLICPNCGVRKANQIRRDGHYKRKLIVSEGIIEDLRVPRIECKDCGHYLKLTFKILDPKKRYWKDVEEEVLSLYLRGVSYRKIKMIVGRKMASRMGITTGWQRIQRIGRKLREKEEKNYKKADILALDEVALRVKGERRWGLLVRTMEEPSQIQMFISPFKDKESWESALSRFPQPRAVVSDGDRAIESAVKEIWPGVRMQRCIWHILRGISLEMKGKIPSEKLRELSQRVREALSSGDLSLAFQKVKDLVWDYGEAGYQIGLEIGKGLEYIRARRSGLEIPQTTSLLERDIKEFRRRVRPMDGFFSEEGARNFSAIWVKMRNLQRQGVDWLEGIMKEAV